MTTMALSTFRFEELPVEMRVKIMSYLDVRDKLRWMQVSKSIRFLCQDESLWQNINLSWKIGVPYSFINFVLEKNCISLILRGTKMIGRALQLTKMCPLRFLDLGHCDINERSINELLFSCQSLEKLSLELLVFDPQTVKNTICIQNGQTLKTLDLETWSTLYPKIVYNSLGVGSLCTNNEQKMAIRREIGAIIPDIVKNCVNLTELNLGSVNLFENSLHYLVNNLTPKISKLSLRGCGNSQILTDEHVKTLVTRCNKLTELNLSYCYKLTDMTLTNIFEHLKDTLEILDLSCCSGISESPMTKFYVFKSMPRLRLLDINYQYVISIEEVISLENQLQNVKICRLRYLGDYLKIAKFWNRKYIGKAS